jgi:predicted regulator of Ras-like GTPase activity (Roadblock/LC7/MglB family)
METILQSLQDLDGVHGAILVDATGQLVAHRAHNMYDADLLQQVSRAVVTAIDAVKLGQEDWESITTHFSEGKLLIRTLTPAGSPLPYTLALIADSRLNPSFATVAIRVALGKLKTALTARAAGIGTGSTLGGSSLGMPKPSPVATQAFSQVKPPTAEVANNGLSWSGFGDPLASSTSGVSVADPNSSALLTAVTKALAKHVGPMAKLFVKEAVRKVCPNRPFSRDSLETLVSELTKSIDKPADAAQFKKSASGL